MLYSVKISQEACQGCVNCIKSCPTEAIRVVDGEINIIRELCVDCGECLRSCRRKALGICEDDWNRIKESSRVTLLPDPSFFSQFSHYTEPSQLEDVLASHEMNTIIDELEDAFDLYAYQVNQLIARAPKSQRPLISCYCPAALRLIQSRFPELLSRVVIICTPLEIAADLWRMRTNSNVPLTLISPCPAKITMIYDPEGRECSPITNAVTVGRVARYLMASKVHVQFSDTPKKRNNRWLHWARRGGEIQHIQAFSDKKLNLISVSGINNTIDLLQELELGRLRNIDFIEARVCHLGCLGGIGTSESRFISHMRLLNLETNWQITEDDIRRAEELSNLDFWSISQEYTPRQRLPLSNNVSDAMLKLQQMNQIYAGLPHIDCGSCGRPSCQAMAEEIVRGHGSATDCIFKLREGIASLANRIVTLSESQPQTLKRKKDL